MNTLEASYEKGARAAAAKLGMEQFPSLTHGVQKAHYPATQRPQQDPSMPDWLFDLFGEEKVAPGGAGGQYGTETIG